MQLFVDDTTQVKDQIFHELIDELINIIELCQAICRTVEPADLQSYAAILEEVTYSTIRLAKSIQNRPFKS